MDRATGFAWQVRFSGWKNGKRHQRTLTFDSAHYKTEKDVRKAIELNLSQINAGTSAEHVDTKFGTIINLYRTKHLPTLEHSTQVENEYLLRKYIEPRFSQTPLREMRPLAIDEWVQNFPLSASVKRSICSLLKVCFRLAALHEFIPPTVNPMNAITVKGASKRQKRIPEISIADFKRLLKKLPEPIDLMVLVDGAYGLRVSELLALKWEDIDEKAQTLSICRKFTAGQLGKTKTAASEAP